MPEDNEVKEVRIHGNTYHVSVPKGSDDNFIKQAAVAHYKESKRVPSAGNSPISAASMGYEPNFLDKVSGVISEGHIAQTGPERLEQIKRTRARMPDTTPAQMLEEGALALGAAGFASIPEVLAAKGLSAIPQIATAGVGAYLGDRFGRSTAKRFGASPSTANMIGLGTGTLGAIGGGIGAGKVGEVLAGLPEEYVRPGSKLGLLKHLFTPPEPPPYQATPGGVENPQYGFNPASPFKAEFAELRGLLESEPEFVEHRTPPRQQVPKQVGPKPIPKVISPRELPVGTFEGKSGQIPQLPAPPLITPTNFPQVNPPTFPGTPSYSSAAEIPVQNSRMLSQAPIITPAPSVQNPRLLGPASQGFWRGPGDVPNPLHESGEFKAGGDIPVERGMPPKPLNVFNPQQLDRISNEIAPDKPVKPEAKAESQQVESSLKSAAGESLPSAKALDVSGQTKFNPELQKKLDELKTAPPKVNLDKPIESPSQGRNPVRPPIKVNNPKEVGIKRPRNISKLEVKHPDSPKSSPKIEEAPKQETKPHFTHKMIGDIARYVSGAEKGEKITPNEVRRVIDANDLGTQDEAKFAFKGRETKTSRRSSSGEANKVLIQQGIKKWLKENPI